MQSAFSQLNWLAIFVAALSTFLIGGIWYTVFKKRWMTVNNFTESYLAERKLPVVFGLSFFFSFIMAFNLAMFIGAEADISYGMTAGFFAGFGWVFFSLAIISLFEKRSLAYILINGGYMTIAFIVMGAILGGWH